MRFTSRFQIQRLDFLTCLQHSSLRDFRSKRKPIIMKYISLAFAFLFLISCGDDEPTSSLDLLSNDGDNANSPVLPADNYEAATYFPASTTSLVADKKIDAIEFFIAFAPELVSVNIYRGGSTSPGELVYSQEIFNVRESTWNIHLLNEDVLVGTENLWLAVKFRHNDTLQSIGCDAGPGEPNADVLFQGSTNSWISYESLANESINWNIRARLVE